MSIPGQPAHAPLLTLDEAARQLSVSRRTIYTMIANGDLEDCYVGPKRASHRVVAESLLDYIERQRHDGTGG